MTKDEMKNRISMALKAPVLQQGFEIICKNLSELEKENKTLVVNKLLPEENEDYFFIYGSGHSEYNNAKNNEWLSMLRKCLEMKEQGIDVIQQLEQAKEIIKGFLSIPMGIVPYDKLHEQAKQFLRECK